MLKFTIASLNDVPAPLREHYTAKEGGGFALALDGHPDSERLPEFRDRNTQLLKQLAQFEGLDATAARAALAKAKDTDPKVAELEAALAAERAARTAAEATAGASVLKAAVTAAFTKAGGRPKAAEFITSKAAEVFNVVNGNVTTTTYSSARPGELLNLDEWIVLQAAEHDFAFAPSSGGGARPSGGGHGPTDQSVLVNPSPADLGRFAADIAAGRKRIQTT